MNKKVVLDHYANCCWQSLEHRVSPEKRRKIANSNPQA